MSKFKIKKEKEERWHTDINDCGDMRGKKEDRTFARSKEKKRGMKEVQRRIEGGWCVCLVVTL